MPNRIPSRRFRCPCQGHPVGRVMQEHIVPSWNKRIMTNIWNNPSIQQKGWRCVDVTDVRPDSDCEYETCGMCGNHPIRFVHAMKHDDYGETLGVGCVCAEHMTNDYISPKTLEKHIKRKAARRRNFLSLNWNTSKRGSSTLRKNGMTLHVFPHETKPGYWRYRVNIRISREAYPSHEEAKLALFNKYYENLYK